MKPEVLAAAPSPPVAGAMQPAAGPAQRWHRRLRHSLRARLVALFLLFGLALAATFLAGAQRLTGAGWREMARPLLADYVDRLAADIGTPPDPRRAAALAARLPLTVRIEGPAVQWRSHPAADGEGDERRHWGRDPPLLARTTADGHRITFGVDLRPWRERPRLWGWLTLAALLLLTAVAYHAVRRLLRPLDDIGSGARRFGSGDFGRPIPVRRHDELGELAAEVNGMAASIHGMLEAKRALLLAISHELRSPITRARLHAELLDEAGDTGRRRAALLADLQAMADLVADLLESERLGGGHAALQREPTDLAALVRECAEAAGPGIAVQLPPALPPLALDPARIRLLLRNLLDNAQRHGRGAQPPVLRVVPQQGGVLLELRDHGPGVADDALARLAQPFWRPDDARTRAAGGVGLGLYLARLVAEAHGGRLELANAGPGLQVRVTLPAAG